jgi:quercetin dioxygenase-like cupin family protein
MFALFRARPKTAPQPPPPLAPAAPAATLERLEAAMLEAPQVPLRFVHHFAPGVYAREMIAPAGALVLGHAHREACLNIVLAGRARVRVGEDGPERVVKAGDVFVSPAGVRKLGLVEEELRFLNVHANPDDTTDLAAIAAATIEQSPTFARHAALEAAELRPLKQSEASA